MTSCSVSKTTLFVTFRLADSLPHELLDDWLRAREAFLAANPPPWDDITEACDHGQFSGKLDEHLDAAHGFRAMSAIAQRSRLPGFSLPN